jgi:putative ABC transport system substrate-binding protein
MMRRRTALFTALAEFAIIGRAQADQPPIGWISQETRQTTEPFIQAFKAGLADRFAGRSAPPVVEKYVTGGAEAVEQAVRELERAGVALIVAQGSATVPVVRANPSVPVVFGFSGDPVVAGIARSLAQPGGNATGVSFMSVELMPKRIDLLRLALPACRRVGLLSNTLHPGEEKEVLACQRAVESQGVEVTIHRVKGGEEIAGAVERALVDSQAIVMLPSATMVRAANATAAQCAAKKVPLVSGWATIARAGAMMTYGPNLDTAYRRVAYHVLRVLNGTPPASLPVEQPTQFELVLNRRTADGIGVTLPATLLAQADEVID